MKLLITTDPVGGVWTYTTELLAQLCPLGVDVALASIGGRISSSQREELQALGHLRVHESAAKLEWMDNPWKDVSDSGQWLLEIARDFKPDVIHLNQYSHGSLPWRAPVLMVGHSCVLSWWQAVKHVPAGQQWETYRSAVTDGLHAAGAVLAPSVAMLRELQRLYGPLRNCGVIPNARRSDLFTPGRKRSMILSAGRLWDEAKNISALCRAATDLPWPVLIAGESRHPQGQEMGLPNVRLLGKLPAAGVARWMEQASIYAAPARYEPFGLSILEAAICGCALVLGDIASLRENWTDAALFVDPEDAGQLKDALLELIADPALRDDLAANALQRSREFVPTRMACQYLAAYRRLMPEGKPAVREIDDAIVKLGALVGA